MSIRNRMREQTANLRSTEEVPLSEAQPTERLKTAVGLNAVLSETKLELNKSNQALEAANNRIKELELKGSSAELPIALISPNPWQPRILFKPETFAALVQSISELGQRQPIVVRVDPADATRFQIVSGERRWRALTQLGSETIKTVVTEASDADMAVIALSENVVRDGLCDFEIARSIKATEKAFPNRTRLAEAIGYSRVSLYRFFAFDKLPSFVLEDLERAPDLISGGVAYELSTVLGRTSSAGEQALKDLWPDLVAGRIQQTKIAELVDVLVQKRSNPAVGAVKDSLQLFAGKVQVGSITKDSRNLAVKIKVGALTESQEAQLRELVTNFFRGATP